MNNPLTRSRSNNPLGVDLFNNTNPAIMRPTSPSPLHITSARGSFHSQHDHMIRSQNGSMHQGQSAGIVGFGNSAPSPLLNKVNPLITENRFSMAVAQQSQQNHNPSPLQQPYGSVQPPKAMYRSHQNLPSFHGDRNPSMYQVESPYGMPPQSLTNNQDGGLRRGFTSHSRLPMAEMNKTSTADISPEVSAVTSELISALFDNYALQAAATSARQQSGGMQRPQGRDNSNSQNAAQLRSRIVTLDSSISSQSRDVQGLVMLRETLKQKRRHLRAKREQAAEAERLLVDLHKQIRNLKQELQDESNRREIERTRLIGELERPLRQQAETKAMRAALDTYWAHQDPEIRAIADRARQLEAMTR